MKKYLLCVFLLVQATASQGQTASYSDGTLSVPQAAIVDADNPGLYTDIQLDHTGDGNFRLVAATPGTLVAVDSVTVNLMESFPVQVSVVVTGNKSVPCVELIAPAISRQDNLFIVVLGETLLGPAESCIAMLDPFETTIPLDVAGLSAGTYTVRVNGVEADFTLDMDN